MMEIPSVISKKRKNLSSPMPFHQFVSAKTPRLHFNPTSDQDSTSSCCSSGSEVITQNADLQDEGGSVVVEDEAFVCYSERGRNSTETTAYSDLEEEETSASEKLDSSREETQRRKMPTEKELEDFFTQAEQNLNKQFSNKYNYDVVKDEPLEGRYEWLKLDPPPPATTTKNSR